MEWTLEKLDLKADFTALGNEREFTLDASNSKGKIKEYKWTFAQSGGGSAGVKFDPGVELSGKTVNVTLLEPTEVTLTVSDGKKRHKKTMVVGPQMAEWKTPCGEEPNTLALNEPRLIFSNGYNPMMTLGQNVCALCFAKGVLKEGGEILHPTGDDQTPYTMAEVKNGPFKGTWYVSKYTAEIRRQRLIHPDLLPVSKFYQWNIQLHGDVAIFAQARQDHEHTHTVLIQEALDQKQADPAPRLQKLFGQSEDDLQSKADGEIRDSEAKICDLYLNENLVRQRLREKWGDRRARLYFPTSIDLNPKFTEAQLYLYNFLPYSE